MGDEGLGNREDRHGSLYCWWLQTGETMERDHRFGIVNEAQPHVPD